MPLRGTGKAPALRPRLAKSILRSSRPLCFQKKQKRLAGIREGATLQYTRLTVENDGQVSTFRASAAHNSPPMIGTVQWSRPGL